MESEDTAVNPSFGVVLRGFRRTAGLTQEELAARAGMSARGLRFLERGVRQLYRDTVQRLAVALALASGDQAVLAAAARAGPGGRRDPPHAGPRHNLPVQVTSFIGREQERVQVLALLERAPLGTLTGMGGASKTRLALAVAGELLARYTDGVWLVDLAPLADPRLLAGAVRTALDVRPEQGALPLVALTDHLKEQHLLLVLDNCEHLINACAALVTALLRACPRLHIMATSREPLAVAGESVYRVPPLSVPDPRRLPPLELIPAYETVRLFVARAQARQASFSLTAQNAATVAAMCARLDGIPLAIELAAARVGSLPLKTIAARLDQSLRLLTGGCRAAPSRQQTLRGALDWSWDLLSDQERAVLRRLSVFTGGWALEAAEAVCVDEGIDTWEVADLLAMLEGKSLLLLAEHAGEVARYRLLELVRQYAAERLAAAGEEAALRERHLDWCLSLAEHAEPHLSGAAQATWLSLLETEHDNLRAALRWGTRQAGTAAAGMRLAAALWRFWSVHGHLTEGRGWLEALLAHAGATDEPAGLRARVLDGAGHLARIQGDYSRAVSLYEESLALRRAVGDPGGTARSLSNLGLVAEHQGDYARAAALYEESLALYRALDDTTGIAHALTNLGSVAYRQGDYARAVELDERSLALKRALGDTWGLAYSIRILGLVAERQGDYAQAAALHEESLAFRRVLGDTWGTAVSLHNLGSVAYRQGDYARAAALQEESLVLMRALGDKRGMATALEGFARLAGAQNRWERATRLWSAAGAVRRVINAPRDLPSQAEYEHAMAAARAALGEEAYAAAQTAGAALSLDDATAPALDSDHLT